MIDFRELKITDKPLYEEYLAKSKNKGCEMSFGNLFMWGKQEIAKVDDHLVFLATFSKSFYPFPLGDGDKKPIIDTLMLDAKERGIEFTLTSVTEEERAELERLYPQKFEFTTSVDTYDYVYAIDDLAGLLGKKYHKKRNHLNNFKKAHPNYKVNPINEGNKEKVEKMVEKWYDGRGLSGSFDYERVVFKRAMDNYDALQLEGLVLEDNGEVLAVTFASRLNADTFDVHFEKALPTVDGAYPTINFEFANYIKTKYPEIKFLDREEDMGIEGLRKAKQSYYPHHQVLKYKARLK